MAVLLLPLFFFFAFSGFFTEIRRKDILVVGHIRCVYLLRKGVSLLAERGVHRL